MTYFTPRYIKNQEKLFLTLLLKIRKENKNQKAFSNSYTKSHGRKSDIHKYLKENPFKLKNFTRTELKVTFVVTSKKLESIFKRYTKIYIKKNISSRKLESIFNTSQKIRKNFQTLHKNIKKEISSRKLESIFNTSQIIRKNFQTLHKI